MDRDDPIVTIADADSYVHHVVDASRERPVLVDFWSPRCIPCVQMSPWVEKLATRMAGHVQVAKVNSMANRQLCADLHVMGLPTFIVYTNGTEACRLTGDECTETAIEEALGAASHLDQG